MIRASVRRKKQQIADDDIENFLKFMIFIIAVLLVIALIMLGLLIIESTPSDQWIAWCANHTAECEAINQSLR